MRRPARPDDAGSQKPEAASACAVGRLAPARSAIYVKEQRSSAGYISGLSSAWQPAFISRSDRSPDVRKPVMALAQMRKLMARSRGQPDRELHFIWGGRPQMKIQVSDSQPRALSASTQQLPGTKGSLESFR